MKVAFYINTILEYYGGTEKWMIDTSLELSRRYPDLDISIVTRDDNYTEKLNKILAFIRGYKFDKNNLYKESFLNISNKLQKIQYIKTNSFSETRKILKDFDVVYSKNEILEAINFKYFIKYKYIKKLVFGCHTPLFYPNGNFLRNFLYTTKIYSFFTSGVKKFHVLNSEDEKILKKLKRKVVKIFNPINMNQIQNNYLVENTFPFQISRKYFNIAWIGRLTYQKGIDSLEKIIERFSENNFSDIIRLHIVGEGEERERITALVKKYNFIKYYGYLENKYVPSFLSQVNLLISTSVCESYGLTILEANAVNVPVLAFDITGPNELIINGKNGFTAANINEYYKKLESIILGGKIPWSPKETILKIVNNEKIYKQLYTLLVN